MVSKWGALVKSDIKDYGRSCERGLGGSTRPRPLPIELLRQLPAAREAWISDGPVKPKAAFLWILVVVPGGRTFDSQGKDGGDKVAVDSHRRNLAPSHQ